MVIADIAWSGLQINPIALSIAQAMRVATSQYFIAAGELQQALRRLSIAIPPSHGLPLLLSVVRFNDRRAGIRSLAPGLLSWEACP
ncbi:MAG: hypothetical protein MN733_24330, partial [Nitrososphaera sp.]|nr:hypothetical protein [Nitrososphaera sp.]